MNLSIITNFGCPYSCGFCISSSQNSKNNYKFKLKDARDIMNLLKSGVYSRLSISGGGDPLYVIRLNPEKHQVIVGPYAALARTEIRVKEVNWLGEIGQFPLRCEVKVRSTRPPVPADVYLEEGDYARVVFSNAEYGVAAGQACVFYEENRVLGGGWILRDN